MRNVYLSNQSPDEALEALLAQIEQTPTFEEVLVGDSFSRVTFEAVYAKQSAPHYNASAMDGVQVDFKSTRGANDTTPKILVLHHDFEYVDTGDPILSPFNAVIMIEDVVELENGNIQIVKTCYPWENVRSMGEDIVCNEMILPAHHQIRSEDMGALLSGGIASIRVCKQASVGILPTGDELVCVGTTLKPGMIVESNATMLASLCREYGAIARIYARAKDNLALLAETLDKMVEENDIVIVNAGSSAGREDFTTKAIDKLGRVLVHGVSIKPGKPTILGVIRNKPIIGLPGYPIASYISFDVFVKPLLHRFHYIADQGDHLCEAVLSKRVISSLKYQEHLLVKLGQVGKRIIATPLNRGAGVTMSLVRSDGLLTVPKNVEGFQEGSTVSVRRFKHSYALDQTLVSIGSHDVMIDIVGSLMCEQSSYRLASTHVGSMGGIMALKREEAHLAPIHLLDENSGVYNAPFLARFLPEQDILLIKAIKRPQGFMVLAGNPKKISSFEDLQRADCCFINRQRGSGTRILLDYQLKTYGILSEDIVGYDREMNTHLAVAAAVLSGSADVGVGVYSAAKALGLDFIQIGYEEYDFAIPARYINDPKVELLLEILRSKRLVKELAPFGYTVCTK